MAERDRDDDDSQSEVSTAVVDVVALEAINRSELDIQIVTAKRFPRNLAVCRQEAMAMVTADKETAGDMFYTLERKGKDGKPTFIVGKSVRMAEVVFYCWRNIHVVTRDAAIEKDRVIAQGVAWDLERNNRRGYESSRSILRAGGGRFGQDMIMVTMAAAKSIAFRNAIFGVIPNFETDRLFEAAKVAALGEGKISEQREKALDYFETKLQVPRDLVLRLMKRETVKDLDAGDLITLRGLVTSIKEGIKTVADIFSETAKTTVVETEATVAAVQGGEVSAHDDARTGAPAAEEPAQEGQAKVEEERPEPPKPAEAPAKKKGGGESAGGTASKIRDLVG
jgi:hypothetical protein